MQAETIAAIATAIVPQQGSVGIVRLSGAEAVEIARHLFYAPGSQAWESHRILYGFIRQPKTQQVIDEALLLLMYAPRSFTREDVIEFHCHGGIMAVQQVLQLCLQQGARLAQPGEFSLRAFLNGRLDLTQAESVADLVGAQSPQAAQAAVAGLRGKLAQSLRQLRSDCLDLLAEIEARIDFEDDLPPLDLDWVRSRLDETLKTVRHILATAHQGELLRAGLKVAIIGRPNVGKSSLLNAWSKSDRAIVTDLPGTTRDIVESQLVVGGIPIQVLDTAGIRESSNPVEQMGIQRSRAAVQRADLVLLTVDAAEGWAEEEDLLYELIQPRPHLVVINKIDLVDSDPAARIEPILAQLGPASPVVQLSASQSRGLEALEQTLLKTVEASNLSAANLDLAINQRQAGAIAKAQNALQQVQATIQAGLPLDFWTIDLRAAIQDLGEVTGEAVTESMLDEIFSRFCIGK